ncbi:Hypothetical protein LEPBI_I1257 [Leptospira biflexa serovar Patoc strain 'Patoc 1 (Paris)']|uniref:Uncharacterized protein n=1 Tax=Leptospira biflexa serovar Patoc (strain Patoc 1 / ATCC 23582 / Paris) TaxID=456481 RepID=B0SP45_LEPBP|nr:Hypothetical protein LEPBI_I1257 [Leptospira biflexa serovar Patoc strain 'Patoc 1 (Paris)']
MHLKAVANSVNHKCNNVAKCSIGVGKGIVVGSKSYHVHRMYFFP